MGGGTLSKEGEVEHHNQQCNRHEFACYFGTIKWPILEKKNEDISSVKPRDRSDGLDSFERP